MRTERRKVWLFAGLHVAVLACRAATGLSSPVAVELTPAAADADHRWYDIADNLYSSDLRSRFDYADANVRVQYERAGTTLVGRLVGDGLKPFFAYQLKLAASHDNSAMERLGYLGRWVWEGGPLNVADYEYEAHKGDPGFSSFLLFDYCITDEDGRVEEDFRIDSSYHVLFRDGVGWVPGARPPGPNDGFSVDTLVDPAAATPGTYQNLSSPVWVSVYGEYEHTRGNVRPLPGELLMPAGDYSLQFMLTEESFHYWGGLGGYWMTALTSPPGEDITFSIISTTIPEPVSICTFLCGALICLKRRDQP